MATVVRQMSQSIYTAHKVFRVVQPNAIQEQKDVEINIPMYNDLGEAIGKFHDYSAAKFDIRIISGSTLPINRWAYLDELKELMKLGVIDDIALLAETDLRNKQGIADRKSQLAQMQGQVSSSEETIKDLQGTIETLERQLVQAGIKGKVMQADVEINKKKEQVKASMNKTDLETEAKLKLLANVAANNVQAVNNEMNRNVQAAGRENMRNVENYRKSLENTSKE